MHKKSNYSNQKKENKSRLKKIVSPGLPKTPIEFYISEETAEYGDNKPFTIYYDNPEHSVRLLKGDCIEILNQARENSVDMIFADPPYFLSNGGITCHAGRMVSVNKGKWDKSKGVEENHKFTLDWLRACQRVLKSNGTIWVSGTTHIIYSVGYAMQELGYKILNDIIWYKRNASPNPSHKYLTQSTEIFIWAAKNQKSKHYFDYQLTKKSNNGKQMRNLWKFDVEEERISQIKPTKALNIPKLYLSFGKHIIKRPIELLKRIILASTKKGDLILDPFCRNKMFLIIPSTLARKFVGILLKSN
jgi:site-specific DNA-methyltransferase (adenine-specific)